MYNTFDDSCIIWHLVLQTLHFSRDSPVRVIRAIHEYITQTLNARFPSQLVIFSSAGNEDSRRC